MHNTELLKEIDKFYTTRMYNYALMINGQWGCGKTFFVKEVLIPHLKKHEKHPETVYISLYGISNIQDVSSALLLKSLKDKTDKVIDTDGKVFKVGSFFASNLVKTILHKYEISTDGVDNTLENLMNFDNTIVIFDDLERCNCDVNQVLGFINNFVEHSNASVIIVANEEEIGRVSNNNNYELQMLLAMNPNLLIEKDDLDSQHASSNSKDSNNKSLLLKDVELRRAELFNSRNKYLLIKEKVIGRTIEYEPDINEVFSNLTAKVSNEILKACISSEMETLVNYAYHDNHKNIRTFQFFLEKITCIFEIIENKYQALHSELVKYCYRTSIKYMSGKKMPVWKEEIGLQRFGDFWDVHDYLSGFRFVDDLVQGRVVDTTSVKKLLSDYEKQVVEEGKLKDDPLKKLQGWSTAEDEEVRSWLINIKAKIDNNDYSLLLFPKILQLIVNFESRKIFKKECEEIWNSMRSFAQTVDAEKLTPLTYGDFFTFQDSEAAKELFSNRQKELVDIIGQRNKTSEEITYNQAIQDKNKWADNLYEITTCSSNLNGHSFVYWLNTDDIVQLIVNCKNEQLYSFRMALHALYKSNRLYYHNKVDDLQQLQKLLQAIKAIEPLEFGEIKKIKIKWLVLNLEEYIEDLSSYAKTSE